MDKLFWNVFQVKMFLICKLYTQQLLYSYTLINCLKEKCATVHDSLFFLLLLSYYKYFNSPRFSFEKKIITIYSNLMI